MFLDLPGHSEGTNRQISPRSVDWCSQIGLGGPGTCLTQLETFLFEERGEISFGVRDAQIEEDQSLLGMFLDLPGQSNTIFGRFRI